MYKGCVFLLCDAVSTGRPGFLRVHILDSSLLNRTLHSAMGSKQNLVTDDALKELFGGLTFGQLAAQSDMYGLPLRHISKTSLAFMSALHIRWARDAKWVFSSVDDHLLSYSSDGDKRDLVEKWVAQSRLASRLGRASEYVTDDPATSSSDNSGRQSGTSVEGVDALAQVDAREEAMGGVLQKSAEGGALAAAEGVHGSSRRRRHRGGHTKKGGGVVPGRRAAGVEEATGASAPAAIGAAARVQSAPMPRRSSGGGPSGGSDGGSRGRIISVGQQGRTAKAAAGRGGKK